MTGPIPFRLPRYADNRYATQRRAGFPWLRFTPDLEKEYREQHPLLNPNRLRLAHALALAMLFGFITLDWLFGLRVLPPAGTLILAAVTAPALAAPIVATSFLGAGVKLQRVVFISGMVLGLSTTVVAEMGRAAGSWFPYEALILVIMYVYLVSGLLYFQAAGIGLSMWALFALCESAWSTGPGEKFVYESYFLLLANVIGLLGLYALQYEARRAFLMQNELRQESMRDDLTGVLNRREFRRHLNAVWLQARREGASIGLMMIDVDNFKHINDTCGHLAGDEALKLVGGVLQDAARRPLDAIGRYGGDEFLGVWYGIDSDMFEHLARTLPARVAAAKIPGADAGKGQLAISGGAVFATPDQVMAPQDAIRLADRKLYEMKVDGGSIATTVLTPDSRGS